jgi:hypothetical protein
MRCSTNHIPAEAAKGSPPVAHSPVAAGAIVVVVGEPIALVLVALDLAIALALAFARVVAVILARSAPR